MIGRRLRGPPLVSSCATGRRCSSAPIRPRTRRPSPPLTGVQRQRRARPLICSMQWATIKVWNRRVRWQRPTPHYL